VFLRSLAIESERPIRLKKWSFDSGRSEIRPSLRCSLGCAGFPNGLKYARSCASESDQPRRRQHSLDVMALGAPPALVAVANQDALDEITALRVGARGPGIARAERDRM